jgi:anaerobic magnesium-protoporphyrin IX monomethyl ester cyclase
VRVLFTSAPEPDSVVESAEALLPLALVHLAGAVRAAGHECEIVDALSLGLGAADVEAIAHQTGSDVVCVSAATPGFPAAMDLCRRVRSAGRTTVVGGVHASFMYPEFLPSGAVDFAVVGEGEETLPELLRCLAAGDDPARIAGIAFGLGGRVIRTAPRPRLAALDPLPKAWDLLPMSRYRWAGRPRAPMGAITTSRGCPRRCGHCCQATQYEGTWRMRSVDSVAYELVQLRREHDVELVCFHDPAPTVDASRFAELTERLVELDLGLELVIWSSVADVLRDEAVLPRWRDAGVIHVGMCRDPSEDRREGAAMERSVSEGRRAVRALRRAGITCETSFWLGFPDETPATVDATSSRARAWDADVALFPLLTPLPYTPAWRTYGAHVITRDYRRYNQRDPVVKPRAMELQEVVEAAERCRRQFTADRPSRTPPGTGRRAGPWLVHPGEPELGGPVPEGLGGDGRDADPASPPGRRN